MSWLLKAAEEAMEKLDQKASALKKDAGHKDGDDDDDDSKFRESDELIRNLDAAVTPVPTDTGNVAVDIPPPPTLSKPAPAPLLSPEEDRETETEPGRTEREKEGQEQGEEKEEEEEEEEEKGAGKVLETPTAGQDESAAILVADPSGSDVAGTSAQGEAVGAHAGAGNGQDKPGSPTDTATDPAGGPGEGSTGDKHTDSTTITTSTTDTAVTTIEPPAAAAATAAAAAAAISSAAAVGPTHSLRRQATRTSAPAYQPDAPSSASPPGAQQLAAQNAELSGKLGTAVQALKQLRTLADERESRLRARLEEAEAETGALRQELNDAAAKLAAVHGSGGGDGGREKERESHRQRIDALTAELDQARMEAIEAAARERLTMDTCESLRTEIAELRKSADQGVSAARAAAQSEVERLNTELSTAASSLAASRVALEAEQETVARERDRAERATEDAATARKELREYRQRAVQALQAREEELRQNSTARDQVARGDDAGRIQALEAENAALRGDISALRGTLAEGLDAQRQLEDRCAHAEALLATETESHAHAVSRLHAQERTHAEHQSRTASRISQLESQLAESRSDLATLRSSAEAETHSLRQRLERTETEGELAERVRSLTEHVVGKQGQIATLQAEKSALQHEVSRLRESERSRSAVEAARMMGGAGRRPTGNEDAFVSGVDIEAQSLHVRRVATTVDAIGITLARGIRRSPAFRYGILGYIILLHAWVYYFVAFFEREHHPANFTRNNH